nr:hypothetical protein GTC16762_04560 [Pigmentibacter ruber]
MKILYFLLLFFPIEAFSVNIISWWGYLDQDLKESITKKCKTEINIDEYFSTEEFLRRTKNGNYSILIYSMDAYNLISNKIVRIENSNILKNYHKNVRSSFSRNKMSKYSNIYALGTSGYLYNKKYYSKEEFENLDLVLAKYSNSKVILGDSMIENIRLLGHKDLNEVNKSIIDEFKNKFKNNKVLFTNDFTQEISISGIQLGYVWLGFANSNLDFIVDKKFNFVSADLISLTENSVKAKCVMNELSSKKTLEKSVFKNNYFSPYSDFNENYSNKFNVFYKNYMENFDKNVWVGSFDKVNYDRMNILWKKIKISLVQ